MKTDARMQKIGYEYRRSFEYNEDAKTYAAKLRKIGYRARVAPVSHNGTYTYRVYAKKDTTISVSDLVVVTTGWRTGDWGKVMMIDADDCFHVAMFNNENECAIFAFNEITRM